MNLPTQEEIFERFPVLFSQKDLTIQESCMAWGLSHGEGWNRIIVELCEKINAHLKQKEEEGYVIVPIGEDEPIGAEKFIYQVEFAQVKSKWYQLRIYHIGGDEWVSQFIGEAEKQSLSVCEGCGLDVTPEEKEGGSRCQPCREKRYT